MTRRVGLLTASLLLVAATLMGCSSHRREFPALVTNAEEIRLQDMWTQLQPK